MSRISAFVEAVLEQGDYTQLDTTYLFNRVLHLVGEDDLVENGNKELTDLVDDLVILAVQNGNISDTLNEKEELAAELMNFITPIPSKLNQHFWATYAKSPKQAIADFYQLSRTNDTVKTKAIAKNIAYSVETEVGELEITINLSKPEKDPKAIALAKQKPATQYPLCQLCIENEGYQGRVTHPARANHRVIRFPLGEENWGFQYSPYAYFNEHSIFLDTRHVPMVISRKTFEQLLDIVARFPDYFVGSNADLPIVGGSILSHNHYQAGRHTFPMEKAELEYQFVFKGYENVSAGIVKWPMSVIRLMGKNQKDLVDLADKILLYWKHYSDISADIVAYTGDISHHTVTPIARKKDDIYELDLVLRDNHTSSEHPDGVYHPHADVHHIKKENIGLIEVMGLAVLPPRLKEEMKEVAKYMLGQYNKIEEYHKSWADGLKVKYPEINENQVMDILRKEIGFVFLRVLEDAGVYKSSKDGRAAFLRFVEYVGIKGE